MTRAVCPGSFDPVTLGHLDIVTRAARLFDEVVVAIGTNASKRRLFTPEERIDMLVEATAHLPGVRVEGFTGLLTDFCAEQGAEALVKGLRGSTDYEYELPMARMNDHLSGVETVFVAARPQFTHVSSSLVKEVASLGGDVSAFLTPAVHERLLARLAQR
ncbi:pantetheine-phosphate adenylyltransferase [Nocardioides zeae]|uniref:Phosphopantetheine adenylyltransferase n=1 Tax=Nocardioides imazamoxiresistens TaxID=3231893 RepID=A0ABU3PXF2_9ACTN|nr:pantetheine-phosphate adenylyltransferase [Nocardioides zeae]MDT9593904.1 pantetheine-phosphate adenylyltransferase [Nocardioides zeae]